MSLRLVVRLLVILSSAPSPTGGAQEPGAKPQGAALEHLGAFGAWTAVAHGKAGQRVCYAFARATAGTATRPRAALVVAHWPQEWNQVWINAGVAYPRGALVAVAVGRAELPFDTHENTAFARDGMSAVLAFRRGGQAVARRPSRRGGTAADTFSLSGFGPAYDAISRACAP